MENKIWPEEYQTLAQSEGWDVFECDGGQDDGKFRIQKIDDIDALKFSDGSHYNGPDEVFRSDVAAMHFVFKLVREGRPHAIMALGLHGKFVEDFTQEGAK